MRLISSSTDRVDSIAQYFFIWVGRGGLRAPAAVAEFAR